MSAGNYFANYISALGASTLPKLKFPNIFYGLAIVFPEITDSKTVVKQINIFIFIL